MKAIRACTFVAAMVGAIANCSEDAGSFSTAQLAIARQSAAEVDGGQLRRHVESLVTSRNAEPAAFVSWYPDHPHTHVRSADYVRSYFEGELHLRPTQEDSTDDGIAGANVWVDIVGTQRPSELVLLTAHVDAWFSGADDNASGVAVLLEAARILARAPTGRTVRILAFDLEEYGLLGANRYLEKHGTDGVVAVVNLDGVAFASHAPGSQEAPPGLALHDVGDFVAVLANGPATRALTQVARMSSEMPLPAPFLGVVTTGDGHYPGTADFLLSDHAPFWRAGVPALFFTDTGPFRNPNYHTVKDTPDSIDDDFFLRTAQLVVGAVHAFATID